VAVPSWTATAPAMRATGERGRNAWHHWYQVDRISDPTGNLMWCWRRAAARTALGRRRDGGARAREREGG
jgi:hypothetical protein